ncbi:MULTISPECIES: UDP-N-acetylmuramate dehydrogenase [Thalassotalea]|uniref:UDP-N-acetylenolpyruvoylglucosamine reductase n=1 Tax=Thalassotalea castellviae TaxID=3075612 RepID=A0ABU3A1I7_9GAMM|nr:UDP-N-acetylmuramate dehydrogenase [Thalassotalea sp. W431]MDT0604039.1 UDP-N-acetylmuramate dehydrogenase [Thalassotalea sp. W431]
MQHQYDLSRHNSFAFPAICPAFYQPHSLSELDAILEELTSPFYILGAGSNTLFTEAKTTTILQPAFKGISVNEDGDSVLVSAQCGENWHALVSFCVDNQYYGIENLALIPGSVGAAPVQNIGAYGTELADVIEYVLWYEFESKSIKKLNRSACQFAYRDSIFKNQLAGKGLIVEVTIRLAKQWQANLTYRGLDELPGDVTAKDVFDKVIAIRRAKLPDPEILPNAGSFFKNPVVEKHTFEALKKRYPNIPAYPQENNKVKLAAGWLIEQSGLKGFRYGEVGVAETQALVLVNYASKHGQDIIHLAQYVQKQVLAKFEIFLQAEVRLLSSKGLIELTQPRQA